MEQRKLGRNTTQRMALLKNQVSQLLWYGHIDTTFVRAKEVSRMADKLLNLAYKTWDKTEKKVEERINNKGQKIKVEVVNDLPEKLAARRKIMASVYDLQEIKPEDEPYDAFKTRVGKIAHPIVEKIFNEYAPRIAKRVATTKSQGGYTRVLKTGMRRGDAAETAIIELVL